MTTRAARPKVSESVRVSSCVAAGAVAAVACALAWEWELAVLLGWTVTATALLGWIWWEIGGADAARTAALATWEDSSRTASRVVIVGASVLSLGGAGLGLHRAARVGTGLEIAYTTAAMATVVMSWAVVHTTFLLRYAHLFYGGRQAGGIEFPGTAEPAYRDFAYLAFTIGMTFQVSDTEVTDPRIRATVLRHALLSYLFGTAIIAATINVVAGHVG